MVNGFGRFAYALLLPVMRQDLAWDYAASGWLNTANGFGYGLGALLGWLLLAKGRAQAANLFVAGLAGTVLTLLFCAFTRDLSWMLMWRFASGVGSAWVFACGGALVAERYASDPARAGSAIAVFYAGGGLGIAASSLLVFPVLAGSWAWPAGWLALGLAGLLLAIAPGWLAAAGSSVKIDQNIVKIASYSVAGSAGFKRIFVPIALAYFLFGVGYIVYLTFVIAWLREMRLGVGSAAALWFLLGLAVMASGYLWRGVMARWWPPHTFAAATLCTATGTVLPMLSPSMPMLLLSVCLVGSSFFMAPGAMMALARVTLPQAQWAKAMSLFTFVFAVGQGIGPVAAGWVADVWSLNHAMLAGAATLLLSAVLALLQPRSSPVQALSK